MKQLSILITLLVVSSLALNGKVYPGLKVKGDYKALEVLVESIEEDRLLTMNDVERATKLKLMANGIKIFPIAPHITFMLM